MTEKRIAISTWDIIGFITPFTCGIVLIFSDLDGVIDAKTSLILLILAIIAGCFLGKIGTKLGFLCSKIDQD